MVWYLSNMYKLIYNKKDDNSGMPSLVLNFTKKESNEKIKIHMNAILG